MDKNTKLDPIDEALRLVYLEASSNADNTSASTNFQNILEGTYTVHISEANKRDILKKLNEYASSASFGELLLETLSKKNISTQILAVNLKIAEGVIEDLKADKTFTNNVPVVFVKDILQALGISFQNAKEAILKTFELLKSKAVIEEVDFGSMEPAFRKGYYTARESAAWSGSMTESRDLFENEDALRRYLSRLDELMSK